MKLTLSWLKDHLETEASVTEIADTLTAIGLEVEGVEDRAAELAPFKVARVIEASQHPNADRLRVCRVETDQGEVQVVCGAPNARTGMTGIFAPSGTHIPGTGIDLKPTEIRGVKSNGMLVSEREMGLSDEHEGIIELPEGLPVGAPMAQVMGLDDPVIEIAVTPNRPDAFGIRGIARDLAAAGLGTLKPDTTETITGSFDCPVEIRVENDGTDPAACPVFVGRYIRGVTNGPSPAWLQQRLRAIGLRPINALADITNYISVDRARPLHVYDADKLRGAVRARLGVDGESFLALDGKTYAVDESMCVIADDANVLGLGGVMGGEDTGVSEATVNVLIESAYFDPLRTAFTGRKTGIISDARMRFERGIDPTSCVPGTELATRMILDLCGGEPSTLSIAGQVPDTAKCISFHLGAIKRLTGIAVGADEAVKILSDLGFGVTDKGHQYHVAPPPWRPDVEGSADIVEEIIRIHGMDTVPPVALPRRMPVTQPVLNLSQERLRLARHAMAARGLSEAITWSFIPHGQAAHFADQGALARLQLENPISVEMDTMRPSLLPGLVMAAQRNADRGMAHQALFEAGQAYAGDQPQDQEMVVAGLRRGPIRKEWMGQSPAADLFTVKADALALLDELGGPAGSVQITEDAPKWYHPGRSGTFRLGPNVLAWFGELHPRLMKAMDVGGPLVAFEAFIDRIPAPRKGGTGRPPLDLPELLPVRRDFAFLLDRATPADQVLRAARGADKGLISEVSVFDVYEGKGVEDGKKSLAIEVVLQPRDKTLTDKEIDAVSEKVVAKVTKATGGALRG